MRQLISLDQVTTETDLDAFATELAERIAAARAEFAKHDGPGPHQSGSPQSVHGGQTITAINGRDTLEVEGPFFHITSDPYWEPSDRKGGGLVYMAWSDNLAGWVDRVDWSPRGYVAVLKFKDKNRWGAAPQPAFNLYPDVGELMADYSEVEVIEVLPTDEALKKYLSPSDKAGTLDPMESNTAIAKHPAPDGSPIHSTGSGQDAHAGGGSKVLDFGEVKSRYEAQDKLPEGERKIWVHAKGVDNFEKKVARLNSRARRYFPDQDPFTVERSGRTAKATEVYKESDLGRMVQRQRAHTWYEYDIKGEPPVVPGYEFVGTIEHIQEEGGDYTNILKKVPGVEADLSKYRDAGPNCDLCKRNIYRRDTFLVRNTETGEIKQLGRDDLQNYTGATNAEDMAKYAAMWTEFQTAARDDDFMGDSGGGEWGINHETYLTHAAMIIRQDGRYRKTSEHPNTKGTVHALFTKGGPARLKEMGYDITPTDQDVQKAKDVMAWLDEMDPEAIESDYIWNLYAAARHPSGVLDKNAGLMASAIAAYDREQGLIVQRETRANNDALSEWVGEIKERRDFDLTITRENSFDGNYGTTYVYEMVDDDANQFVWFASNPISHEIPDTAAIAEHESFIAEGKKIFEEKIVPAGGSLKGMVGAMGHTTGDPMLELREKLDIPEAELEASRKMMKYEGPLTSYERNAVGSYVRAEMLPDYHGPRNRAPVKTLYAEVGDQIKLKATIKDHKLDTYKGRERKQTVITRGKLLDYKAKDMVVAKHDGPGNHESGSPQTVHKPKTTGLSPGDQWLIAQAERLNAKATGPTPQPPTGAEAKEQAWGADLDDPDLGLTDADYDEWSAQYDMNTANRIQVSAEQALDQTDILDANAAALAEVAVNPRPGIDDNPAIVANATQLFSQALDNEADISPVLQKVAEETGGELAGYEWRVKLEDSIRDKLYRDMAAEVAAENNPTWEQVASQVRDLNRYTVTWPADENWVPNQQAAVDALAADGWEVYDHKDKNGWATGDHYNGMNYQFKKGDQYMEVQFHTPESHFIKEESHKIFKEVRILPPEDPYRQNGIAQIWDLWNGDTSHVPPGVESIGTPVTFLMKAQVVANPAYIFYFRTDDEGTPTILFRTDGMATEVFGNRTGQWHPAPQSLPEMAGMGGSSDFFPTTDRGAMDFIMDKAGAKPDIRAKKRPTRPAKPGKAKKSVRKRIAKADFSPTIKIVDTDEPQNLIFGWANVSFTKDGEQVLDHQGHMIDIEDLEHMAYNFTVKYRKSGDMHKSAAFGELVESMVYTPEKLEVLGLPEGSVPYAWWVGFRLPPEEAEKVRKGERSMLSIEGGARLELVDE